MTEKTQKDWIEEMATPEDRGVVATPLDAWIELALYVDQQSIARLLNIVEQAVKRLKWELEEVPTRWVNVRETKIHQLSFWVSLQDKLRSLRDAVDDIPF